MVKMRILDAMPDAMRKRMSYRTRMMTADGCVELAPTDARFFRRMGWAEDAPPEIDEGPAEDVPEPTRAELMARAAELGIELPAGYVRKDALAEMVAAAEVVDAVEDEVGVV